MRTQLPTPLQLREAVRTVLAEPDHGTRAAAMQAEMARYAGAEHAADLLERLAATGAPVVDREALVAV
jgi:UDP:flavonoid glycosyltransferase YjiC (YdhE family)